MPAKPDKLELNRARSFGPKPAKDSLMVLQEIVKAAPLTQYGELEITAREYREREMIRAQSFLKVSHRQETTTRSEIVSSVEKTRQYGICLHPSCHDPASTIHPDSFCHRCLEKAAVFREFVQPAIVPEDNQIRTAPSLCTDEFTCTVGAVGYQGERVHCRDCRLWSELMIQGGFPDENYDSLDEEKSPRKRDKVLQRVRSVKSWAANRKMRKNGYTEF